MSIIPKDRYAIVYRNKKHGTYTVARGGSAIVGGMSMRDAHKYAEKLNEEVRIELTGQGKVKP